MEADLPVRDDLIIPGAELEVSASRSTGPGGQGVNTTSSRVSLSWSVTDSTVLSETQRARILRRLASRLSAEGVLTVHAQDTRSQHQNRELARERLAALVRGALKQPKRRIGTRPSKAAKRRRLCAKRQRGEVKRQRQRPDPHD